MAQRLAQFLNKGMTRDISISKANNEFAFENFNIRLTARDKETLLTATNEKGNMQIPDITINGYILGYCVLNKTLVLFVKGDKDYIYKLEYSSEWTITELHSGDLGFDLSHPIEALGIYEAESIQKIYWVDGVNQPRVINIAATNAIYNDESFDFLPTLKLNEKVKVEKTYDYTGIFPAGIIQYFFTYSRNYGQESSIFYNTPILYLTDRYRGLPADGTSTCGFQITIDNIDTSFDKLNIYSVIRTSENGTPQTKLVTQIDINGNDSAIFLDLNTTGTVIDPYELLYKGSEWISAYTMNHKDNTLFLGNIKLLRNPVSDSLREMVRVTSIEDGIYVSQGVDKRDLSINSGYFPYHFELNNTPVSYFKKGEWYRVGLQFQDLHGKWSDPVYHDDIEMQRYPSINSDDTLSLPRLYIQLSNKVKELAKREGYIKVRPVVVYPEYGDKVCIAQGILNPTVFSFSNRYNNAPFAQPSWFFRTIGDDTIEGRDMHTLARSNSIFGEIQLQDNYKRKLEGHNQFDEWKYATLKSGDTEESSDIDDKHYTGVIRNDNFCVDANIVTLNSPDIDDLTQEVYDNLKLRIVGAVLTSGKKWGSYSVQTSTPSEGIEGCGFFNPDYSRITSNEDSILSAWPCYIDIVPKSLRGNSAWGDDSKAFSYPIYPWHRNGSLNCDIPGDSRTALLKSKTLSNLTYISAGDHYYFTNPWEALDEKSYLLTGISQVNITDPDGPSLSILQKAENSSLLTKYQDIKYFSNIDTVLFPTWNTYEVYLYGDYKEDQLSQSNSIKILPVDKGELRNRYDVSKFYSAFYACYPNEYRIPDLSTGSIGDQTPRGSVSADPVSMKYKSSKHAVFSFNWSKDNRRTSLPLTVKAYQKQNTDPDYTGRPFWINPTEGNSHLIQLYNVFTTYQPEELPEGNTIWIGELYKDINIDNLFGGTSEYAIQNNTWYPCGEAVSLDEDVLYTNEGDTFYQRWDCLKTYPYTEGDQNSIVEILSLFIESHKNIDGRYDRNRGKLDNTSMSPINFNLFNSSYNQKDNLFSYHILPSLYYSNLSFPNQVTWTETKAYGEDIDSWTKINLSSVLDMDGDKGSIQAIRRFNNSLISFQDSGIAEILYNSRTALSTTDGVPVELASSGKVEGKNYINSSVGCSNKWSIIEGKNGLYFIDDLNASINILSNGVQSLSNAKGFKVWAKSNQSLNTWTPDAFDNFRTYYDKEKEDVYFVNKECCLCYSEILQEFTSFYSYEGVSLMTNIADKFISFRDGKLWLQNEGDYNIFFGEHKPYYVEYRITPSPYSDKVFDSIEYRADVFDTLDNLTNYTFDTLEVENEYQYGKADLNFDKWGISNLKRKFRIWRATIPRDTKEDPRGLNRIRNPWITLRLTKDTQGDVNRMTFHDLLVRYSE